MDDLRGRVQKWLEHVEETMVADDPYDDGETGGEPADFSWQMYVLIWGCAIASAVIILWLVRYGFPHW